MSTTVCFDDMSGPDRLLCALRAAGIRPGQRTNTFTTGQVRRLGRRLFGVHERTALRWLSDLRKTGAVQTHGQGTHFLASTSCVRLRRLPAGAVDAMKKQIGRE